MQIREYRLENTDFAAIYRLIVVWKIVLIELHYMNCIEFKESGLTLTRSC